MKILIYGAGSIGTFLGTKLGANNEVFLFGGRKLKDIGSNLEIVTDSRGEIENIDIPKVLLEIGQEDEYDIIFVTTKLYGIKKAIEEIKTKKLHYKNIVFIQNGLVEREFYDELEKMGEIVRMTIYEGYRLEGNKLIAQENTRGWQIDSTKEGEDIARLLTSAGIRARTNSKIQNERAKKTLMVSAASGLAVIENKKIGELLDDMELRIKMLELFREGYTVLKSEFELGEYQQVEDEFMALLGTIREHYPSMYQDVQSGREIEIEFLNGLIVKLGTERKIPTPLNQEIYFRVKRLIEYRDSDGEPNRELKLR